MAKRKPAKKAASEQVRNRTNGGRFQKGQSGNPGGRPKANEEFREACREHTSEALSTLLNWMRGDDPKAAIAAANSILDRGWGKATQPISGEDGAALVQPVINITIGDERKTYSGINGAGDPRPPSASEAGRGAQHPGH